MRKVKDNILPIVLRYEESGVTETIENCLRLAGFKNWEYADREGVGSMAKAFNDAMYWLSYEENVPKYVWFVTNVSFTSELPASLLDVMEKNDKCAAVHPKMHSSHGFITNAKGIEPAHFIEWTAPLVRSKAWTDIGELDEDMPYVHFDLDWSHRAKEKGWQLLIDGRHQVEHTYLHIKQPEKISKIRSELRALKHQDSLQALINKYGNNWKALLCKGGNCG